MTELRDTMMRAINLLNEKGWIQDRPRSSQGICMVTAIMEAAYTRCRSEGYDNSTAAAMVVRQYLQLPSGVSLPMWNDEPGRTKDEVIAVLTKAAEIGEPEKRRVLIPTEVPAIPLSPNSPIWSEPAPEDPNPVKVPERVPA